MDYMAHIEATIPDSYPGSEPWSDDFGSFGSYPAADGLGSSIMRLRVPAAMLSSWLKAHWPRYRTSPFVWVSPRETPGLVPWLLDHGYTLAERYAVLVHDLPISGPKTADAPSSLPPVRLVRTLAALSQVNTLDHLAFPEDPLLSREALRRELRRLRTPARCLYYIEGTAGCARAAGGLNLTDEWAYLWGGETHPDHRHQGLYRHLVMVRLDAATHHGCRFAAVRANCETSAPILLRLGFRKVEAQQVYRPPQAKSSNQT